MSLPRPWFHILHSGRVVQAADQMAVRATYTQSEVDGAEGADIWLLQFGDSGYYLLGFNPGTGRPPMMFQSEDEVRSWLIPEPRISSYDDRPRPSLVMSSNARVSGHYRAGTLASLGDGVDGLAAPIAELISRYGPPVPTRFSWISGRISWVKEQAAQDLMLVSLCGTFR